MPDSDPLAGEILGRWKDGNSWWRLNWEPLPKLGPRPDTEWRMAHEMGAANCGYVWPHAMFASDTEVMQIWASARDSLQEQSVRYTTNCAVSLPLERFCASVDDFIEAVLRRLAATGQERSELAELWALVQADRADSDAWETSGSVLYCFLARYLGEHQRLAATVTAQGHRSEFLQPG